MYSSLPWSVFCHPLVAAAGGLGAATYAAHRARRSLLSGWPFPVPLLHSPAITLLHPTGDYLREVVLSCDGARTVSGDFSGVSFLGAAEGVDEREFDVQVLQELVGRGEEDFHAACQASARPCR